MKLEPPEQVSEQSITIDVREIEPLLQAPPMDLKPWPGAVVATLAMYTPSSIAAYFAGQSWHSMQDKVWRIRLENGLVPVTIGLIIASGWVVAQEAGHDYISYLLTAVTAILVARTNLNPLLLMLVAGIIGFLAWT